MVEASFTGLIRTVLIIIGVFMVVRFLGQMMNAKRNMAEQDRMNEQESKLKSERDRKAKNLGKTSVMNKGRSSSGDIEDVDFEEVID